MKGTYKYLITTDIATTRKNWPKGRFFENTVEYWFVKTMVSTDLHKFGIFKNGFVHLKISSESL